ncbi:MAG: TSUP family transporter [Bacteroidota bacterium]
MAAILYASVGHGGASAYLAILALSGSPVLLVKSSALVMNMLVSCIAFLRFRSKGHFNVKVFLPLAICSVPAAFFSAGLRIEDSTYKSILGLILLIIFIPMFFSFDKLVAKERSPSFMVLGISGLILGLLSGLLGIGGGILLSPLLILSGWAGVKETAGISSLFILVNSLAGLLGASSQAMEAVMQPELMLYLICALGGGLIGSCLGAMRFNAVLLKKTLSIVLFTAGMKLIFGES